MVAISNGSAEAKRAATQSISGSGAHLTAFHEQVVGSHRILAPPTSKFQRRPSSCLRLIHFIDFLFNSIFGGTPVRFFNPVPKANIFTGYISE
ncbi:hypothetical protein AAHA92_13916 [Salvia divinorum]|uniref:Uncharacterized protein n=1 Tax=Salvia divinorum TaxID=28513 RepID=A0ABD1H9V4_SALDI